MISTFELLSCKLLSLDLSLVINFLIEDTAVVVNLVNLLPLSFDSTSAVDSSTEAFTSAVFSSTFSIFFSSGVSNNETASTFVSSLSKVSSDFLLFVKNDTSSLEFFVVLALSLASFSTMFLDSASSFAFFFSSFLASSSAS